MVKNQKSRILCFILQLKLVSKKNLNSHKVEDQNNQNFLIEIQNVSIHTL